MIMRVILVNVHFILLSIVYCLPPHWGSEPEEGMIFSGGGVEKCILHGDHSTQDTEIRLSRSWHSRVGSMLVLSMLYPWNRSCQAQWWSRGRNTGYTTLARADHPGIPWQSRGQGSALSLPRAWVSSLIRQLTDQLMIPHATEAWAK